MAVRRTSEGVSNSAVKKVFLSLASDIIAKEILGVKVKFELYFHSKLRYIEYMHTQKYVLWFEDVDKHDVGIVGGKGANLGEMTIAKFPIPYGFVVSSQAYFYFIKENKLEPFIRDTLKHLNYGHPHELQQASLSIRNSILRSPIPPVLVRSIVEAYDSLLYKEEMYYKKPSSSFRHAVHRIKNLVHAPLVAVRSSATAEDLPSASFAGQQDTYLNVSGQNSVLKKVHECWASLFTERAIYYRNEQKFDHMKVGLAAVVQRMVQSDKSGIAFSIDPVTNATSVIVIEAIHGLGEYIVQGKVSPDHYEVDKRSFVVLRKEVKKQKVKLIRWGRGNKEVVMPSHLSNAQKLSEAEVTRIALLVKDIEQHYYFPQDIEWAIEGDRAFIVQSRPITTTKTKQETFHSNLQTTPTPILVGAPASPGIASGPVKILRSPKELSLISRGDVLVAPHTNPDYVPAMKRASAIVTDTGGRTSHAAIVSRELGIPAIVGTEKATKLLKNGQVVTVNGGTGEVYSGAVKFSSEHLHHSSKRKHTITKLYVNLAEHERAKEVSASDCDGVGLLRAEFMIAEIGVHPRLSIATHKEHQYIRTLARKLEIFASAFSPRPIVYRATDFKTNEYRHLSGGARFEPHEENPMLGYRGACRYISHPETFNLELMALRSLWESGYTNMHLMIPFVRAPWEVIKIREIVAKSGLFSYPEFKFIIMAEVPSCALQIEDFISAGIDGVSIGTNDLTMMLLGVDRDNEEIAHLYDERTPIVEHILEYVVSTCSKHGVTSSICGQAASDYPDLVSKLVKAGITSVSVNPDAVSRTRDLLWNCEQSLLSHSLKK